MAGIMGACGDDSGKTDSDVLQAENTEDLCKDGKDNDQNGKTDCEEDSCKQFAICVVTENTEELCKDKLDNDNNGKIDCEEADCRQFAICAPQAENTEELCKDGRDNDYNNKADCADESCKSFCGNGEVPETTEELCKDGRDNDNNGVFDCDDVNCKGFAHCKSDNKCETGTASCSGNTRSYCDGGTIRREYCDYGCNDSRCKTCPEAKGNNKCESDTLYYCSEETAKGKWLTDNCRFGCHETEPRCKTCDDIYGDGRCVNGILPELIVNIDRKAIAEDGGKANVTIALSVEPSADVSLKMNLSDAGANEAKIMVGNADLPADGIVIAKDNWREGVTVQIVALPDDVVDGDKNVSLDISSTSTDTHFNLSGNTSVNITDGNVASIVVDVAQKLVTTEAGGTATLGLHLGSKPSDDVTITLSLSNNDYAGIQGADASGKYDVVFTPSDWKENHSVTIVGKDDGSSFNSPAHTYDLKFSAPSTNDPIYKALPAPDAITLTNLDNDSPNIVTSTLELQEGKDGTLEIELVPSPVMETTVTAVASPAANCVISGSASVKFGTADSEKKKTITVSVPDDDLLNSGRKCKISLTASSEDTNPETTYNIYGADNPVIVEATIEDNDKPEINVRIDKWDDSLYSKYSSQIVGGGCPKSKCASTGTACFSLSAKPNEDVHIIFNVDTDNLNILLAEALNPSEVIFTPSDYNIEKCVTFTDVYNSYFQPNANLYSYGIKATMYSDDSRFNNVNAHYGGWLGDYLDNSFYDCKQYGQCSSLNDTVYESTGTAVDYDFWLYGKPRAATTLTFCEQASGGGCKTKDKRLEITPSSMTISLDDWNKKHTIHVKAVNDSKRYADSSIGVLAQTDTAYGNVTRVLHTFKVVDND